MSDRDILIELAVREETLTKVVQEFILEQKCCNIGFEQRIREIEIDGSKPAEDALSRVRGLEQRVATVESTCKSEEAVHSWWDSTITKWGVISGVLIGVGGFFVELYWKLRYGV